MRRLLGEYGVHPQANPDEFRQVFEGRLGALSRADQLLSAQRSTGASLSRLIEQELACDPSRYTLEGPDVTLHSDCAFALSLLFHELGMNASIHGALSVATGHVHVRWHLEEGSELVLTWLESGGPPVRRPDSPGFGNLLVAYTAVKLKGSADLLYASTGLCCNLRVSLRACWPDKCGAMLIGSAPERDVPSRTM